MTKFYGKEENIALKLNKVFRKWQHASAPKPEDGGSCL